MNVKTLCPNSKVVLNQHKKWFYNLTITELMINDSLQYAYLINLSKHESASFMTYILVQIKNKKNKEMKVFEVKDILIIHGGNC